MKLGIGGWIGLIVGGLGGLFGMAVGIWAAPLMGSVMAILFISIFFSVYWYFFRPMVKSGKLLKTGVQRSAKILKVWDTNVTINNNPQVGILLEIKDEYGKTYQAETRTVISRLSVGNIQPGMEVTVRVNPDKPTEVAIESYGSEAPVANAPAPDTASYEKLLTDINNFNNNLMLTGISAQAKVLKYMELGINVNGNNPAVILFLEVYPGLKEPFTAEAKGVVAEQSVPKFQPGAMISVKYDPNDLTKVTIEHS